MAARRESAETMELEGSGIETGHLEVLADLGHAFASSLDVEKTLQQAVTRITRHLDAAGGALFLLDETGSTLTCVACSGETQITGISIGAESGIVGRCVRNNAGEIVRDVDSDPGFNRSVDERTGYRTQSILCAPLSVKEKRIGAIELINKKGDEGLFEVSDLNLLQVLCAPAALAILNARMALALVEQERIRRELELAAEIQRGLLPAAQAPPFPIHGRNVPARTVSGDFFDFFALPDGRICFNLGDVSGKGMNAALLMVKAAGLYRCLGKTIYAPGALLGLINAEVCETATRGMFITMVGGIYDPAADTVVIANAGHEPPLHHDRNGEFTPLPAEAPPPGIGVGLTPDEGYPETELHLAGGTLYLFSDGVTEGYAVDGRPLAVEGVMHTLRENAALPLPARLDAVVARLDHGGRVLRDDVTILGVDGGGRE